MKLSTLILLLCLTAVELAAQKKKKAAPVSFSNETLLGQIESIEQHCYKAMEKNGKMLKGNRVAERYPGNTFIESYSNAKAQFDRMGQVENLKFYDEAGKLIRQDLHQYNPNELPKYYLEANPENKVAVRIKHEYDDKQQPTAKYLYDEKDRPNINRFYFYNKTSIFIEFYSEKAPYNLRRRVLRDPKGRDMYKVYFDSDGNRTDSVVYVYKGKKQKIETIYAADKSKKSVVTEKYKKGRLIYKANDEAAAFYSTYAYSKKAGNLVRECKMYNNKQEMYNQQIIIYNPAGKLLSFKSINDKGLITATDSCEYDKQNNLTSKRMESKTEKNFKLFNRYEYDDKGNWIIKIVYFDDKPVYYVERKIKYYE